MNTISALKAWLKAATTLERETLARNVGTSTQYLAHLAVNEDKNYKREPKIGLAAAIERETTAMAKASKGRLPVVLRTDLVEGCRGCPYARKVLGERVLQSEFPIVVGVTSTDKTPGEVSVIAPMVMADVPALLKSMELTVAALMSSLKVKV